MHFLFLWFPTTEQNVKTKKNLSFLDSAVGIKLFQCLKKTDRKLDNINVRYKNRLLKEKQFLTATIM